MMWTFILVNLVFILYALFMVMFCRHIWTRLMVLGLLTSLLALEIVMYAVVTEASMYLDVALAFVLLGFMDVQFFSVFLKKRGGCKWERSSERSSSESDC